MFMCITCKRCDHRRAYATLAGKGVCSAECFHNAPWWSQAKPIAQAVALGPLCTHRLRSCNTCKVANGYPIARAS
jgi:hypothetical protein